MIDRKNRDRLAFAMRQLASGRMTNDEFDEVGEELMVLRHTLEQCDCSYDTSGLTGGLCPECGRVCDPALAEIACWAWLFYSDLRTYDLRDDDALGREERKDFARAILFLKTDFEYRYGSAIKNSTLLGEPGTSFMIAAMFCLSLGIAGLIWGPAWLWMVGLGPLPIFYAFQLIKERVIPRSGGSERNQLPSGLSIEALRQLWPFHSEADLATARTRWVFLATDPPVC